MYMHNMDNTSFGITGRIQRFIDVLKEYDSDLSDLLLAQVLDGWHSIKNFYHCLFTCRIVST
jgi:hypothetical protein